jgi:hypothetical protein
MQDTNHKLWYRCVSHQYNVVGAFSRIFNDMQKKDFGIHRFYARQIFHDEQILHNEHDETDDSRGKSESVDSYV